MNLDSEVAVRYGTALFNVANKREDLSTIVHDTFVVLEVLTKRSKLRIFMNGPQFTISDQVGVIERVFKDQIDPLLIQLLDVLIKRRRVPYLEDILSTFNRLVEESRGLYPADVYTAVKIGETQKADLKVALEKYTDHKLNVTWRVNPKMLGGVIYKYRDLLIDQSVKTKLDEIRNRLMKVRVV